jgi:Peptidase A4 family
MSRLTTPVRIASLAGVVLATTVAVATPLAATAALQIVHAPRHALSTHVGDGRQTSTWSASNWSGYAETGKFTGVSGTWTVPAVSASSGATYSSAWIGVDGFNDSSLIQTGTEEDYYSGAAHYDAWWEILPAAETEISPTTYPVSPGDTMSASIWETTATISGRHHSSEHVWDIVISDSTKNWSFTTSQGYNGAGTSSEWIMEAPEVGGRIATLAHYTITPAVPGSGDFDNAGILTSIPSGAPSYAPAGLNYSNDSGVMIQNGAQVSTPGDPDSALTAYNVAYGSTIPSTPSS